MKIIKVLNNREFLLFLSLVLGLLFGHGAEYTSSLIIPLLGLIMTFSIMLISGRDLRSLQQIISPLLLGIVMNYFILSGVLIMASSLLITDTELYTGFILLAAAPPAVAVIPFTDMLQGNRTYALFGNMGGYFAGLLCMPLIAFVFLGVTIVQPVKLLTVILELIVLPVIASRIILWRKWEKRLFPIKGLITNWSFFTVTYTIVGLNRELILNNPLELIPVISIALLSIVVLGTCIEIITGLFNVNQKIAVSIMLLGVLKNYGIAGGVALTLFSTKAALPATISVIVMVLYIIALQLRVRRKGSHEIVSDKRDS